MKRYTPPDLVALVAAPAAIERALRVRAVSTTQPSVRSQARKILTQHVYGVVDRGEQDEWRLTVGGLALLLGILRQRSVCIRAAIGRLNWRRGASDDVENQQGQKQYPLHERVLPFR